MTLTLFPVSWRELWAGQMDVESTGAIFTRPEIVDLILDLVDYRVQKGVRLTTKRVLEPSCGDGAFVSRLIARLIESEAQQAQPSWDDAVLDHALTAADINAESLSRARTQVVQQLTAAGCPEKRAQQLAGLWIVEADFLLEPWQHQYDICLGNPPYVRIELVPKAVLAQYRATYESMGDRADLYVAFIERGLQLLNAGGKLAYIVANRWTKNAYGRTLRALISERYHVAAYLDLAHTQLFLQEVSAYPCIVVLDNQRGTSTQAATLEDIEPATLDAVRAALLPSKPHKGKAKPSALVRRFESWYEGGAPWITTSADHHEQLTRMCRELPTLEDSAPGTKIGIGVATGCDRAFIINSYDPRIENDRQLRLAMPGDPRNEGVKWSGYWLLNPFAAEGGLVDLAQYPGLRAHLERYADTLRARHVAKGRPDSWFRTIDRIWPELAKKPKILVRDIQDPSKPTIGVDAGEFYPHHNLYWIASPAWPLHALQCLMRSRRVVDQVRAHSVAMRGGSIRWQAQVLRQLRIPALASLPDGLVERLTAAGSGDDTELIDTLATEAYAASGA